MLQERTPPSVPAPPPAQPMPVGAPAADAGAGSSGDAVMQGPVGEQPDVGGSETPGDSSRQRPRVVIAGLAVCALDGESFE